MNWRKWIDITELKKDNETVLDRFTTYEICPKESGDEVCEPFKSGKGRHFCLRPGYNVTKDKTLVPRG